MRSEFILRQLYQLSILRGSTDAFKAAFPNDLNRPKAVIQDIRIEQLQLFLGVHGNHK